MNDVLTDKSRMVSNMIYCADVLEHHKPINLQQSNKTKKAKGGRNVIRQPLYLPPYMWSWIHRKAEDLNIPSGHVVEIIISNFQDQDPDHFDWVQAISEIKK